MNPLSLILIVKTRELALVSPAKGWLLVDRGKASWPGGASPVRPAETAPGGAAKRSRRKARR